MDLDAIINESLSFTREAIMEKWVPWILLFICTILETVTFRLIPLLSGYRYRIYQGGDEPPKVDRCLSLFIDGWKLNLIWIGYFILPFLILVLLIGLGALTSFGSLMHLIRFDNPAPFFNALILDLILLFLSIPIIILIFAAISLIHTLAQVRCAKLDSITEAFRFDALLDQIGIIGWGSYILAIAIIWIISLVFTLFIGAVMHIPFIGWLIGLFIIPVTTIIIARYVTLVYESAEDSSSDEPDLEW